MEEEEAVSQQEYSWIESFKDGDVEEEEVASAVRDEKAEEKLRGEGAFRTLWDPTGDRVPILQDMRWVPWTVKQNYFSSATSGCTK